MNKRSLVVVCLCLFFLIFFIVACSSTNESPSTISEQPADAPTPKSDIKETQKPADVKAEPANYSIVEAEPKPNRNRSRFSYRVVVPQEENNKEIIIATIMDVIKSRAGTAVVVWVYGVQDDTNSGYTKAMGEWTEDGKGWSGDDEVDYRLKITFPGGETVYREFSR